MRGQWRRYRLCQRSKPRGDGKGRDTRCEAGGGRAAAPRRSGRNRLCGTCGGVRAAVGDVPHAARSELSAGWSLRLGIARVRRYAPVVASQWQGGAEPRLGSGRDRGLAVGPPDVERECDTHCPGRSRAGPVAVRRYRWRHRNADRCRALARDERKGAPESRAELCAGGTLAGGTRRCRGRHGPFGCRCAP